MKKGSKNFAEDCEKKQLISEDIPKDDEQEAQMTVTNLCCGYEQKAVVSNVNFSVQSGDYLCIVGENGSGKSTLVKTLLGLNKPIGGYITTGYGLKRNEIGYLPQQTDVQRDFPATVWEVVLSGCLAGSGFRPFYNKQEKALARENIEKMGLVGFEKRCYRELSGGQQQRVLLARALCATRKLLLLDEPVSGLDPKVTLEMYELIEKLNREDGVTIIMISHDINATLKYATHVLHVSDEVFFGTREEYLNSEYIKQFAVAGGVE